MLESLRDYWYMWLLLAVLIVVLVWAFNKAAYAVKRRNARVAKDRAELERYRLMLDKYSGLDASGAKDADPAELTEGVTACLQRKIEKSSDFNGEFEAAPLWRRQVYSAWYFAEDSAGKLSFFFKNNGEPLTGLAVGLVSEIYPEISRIVSSMYAMYDDNNDRVSFDRDRIERLDEEFRGVYDRDRFFAAVKEKIIASLEAEGEKENE